MYREFDIADVLPELLDHWADFIQPPLNWTGAEGALQEKNLNKGYAGSNRQVNLKTVKFHTQEQEKQ